MPLTLSKRVVGAHVYHTNDIVIPTNAATIIEGTHTTEVWNSVQYDTHGFHSVSARSKLTVPPGLGGIYLCWARGIWAPNSTGARDLTIKHNFMPPPEPSNGGIAYSGLFPPPIGSFVGAGHT